MKKPNVLLITLDCVRADRMSCYGYNKNTTPNVKMISSKSTIFENAISAAPWSLPSHASIFTGLYPSEHGATTLDSKMRPDVKTIAEIMSESGYETVAICQNGRINKSNGSAKGFSQFYGWEEINAYSILGRYSKSRISHLHGLGIPMDFHNFMQKEDITSRSISLCKRIFKENNNPVFIFVNLINAHFPYWDRLPTRSWKIFLQRTIDYYFRGQQRMSIKRKFKHLATKKEFTEDEFKTMNNSYDACVHYLDSQLGALFEFMREEEIMDRTLLIVTADHGENIGDHKLISHNFSVHDTVIRVPLIVRYPDAFPKNKRIIRQVEIKNIFDTILDVTSTPTESTGKIKSNSLLRAIDLENTDNYTFGEYYPSERHLFRLAKYSSHVNVKDASMRRFVRSKDFKYVKYENGDEEFYSLKGGETKVSPKEHSEALDKLRERLEIWEKGLRMYDRKMGKRKVKANDIEEKRMKERLRALPFPS